MTTFTIITTFMQALGAGFAIFFGAIKVRRYINSRRGDTQKAQQAGRHD